MGCSHQNMAEEAISGVLIKYLHLERRKQFPDRSDDLIRLFILDQACFYRQNRMGSLFVDSGNDPAFPVSRHHRMNLISVMERIIHADDRLDLAERAEKVCNLFLFVL